MVEHMSITVQELIAEQGWKPGKGMSAFDDASNYMGEDYSDCVVGPSQTRDSGSLERSNFKAALEMLGGEHCNDDDEPIVMVSRIGHWACGWVEQILVKKTAAEKLQILAEIAASLEDYSVLDDDAYAEEEQEELAQTLKGNLGGFTRELAEWLDVRCEDGYVDQDLLEERYGEDTVLSVLEGVLQEDGSYHGASNAWVCEASIDRWVDGNGKYHCSLLARDMCKKKCVPYKGSFQTPYEAAQGKLEY